MRKIGVSLIVVLLFCALPASAQSDLEALPTDFERVLLPITVIDVPGSYGTRWSSELWLRFSSNRPFVIPLIAPSACDPPCLDVLLIPDGSFQSGFFRTHSGESAGELLYVDRQQINNVNFSLRLNEVSGATSLMPLQLPVVRERDFKRGAVNILGVPVRSNRRLMLRVYGIDPATLGDVRVQVFSEDITKEQTLLIDQTISLGVVQKQYVVAGTSFDIRPPTAQFDLTQIIPPGNQMVRLEITPLTSNLAIWAFVSITDNATQAVTLRTPN